MQLKPWETILGVTVMLAWGDLHYENTFEEWQSLFAIYYTCEKVNFNEVINII